MPYHHGAAPREVSSASSATASATAEVEVVKETLASPDGVWALLRWQCDPIIRTRDIVREIRAQGARGWHGRTALEVLSMGVLLMGHRTGTASPRRLS